jgi:hypothetical protein
MSASNLVAAWTNSGISAVLPLTSSCISFGRDHYGDNEADGSAEKVYNERYLQIVCIK